MRLKPSGGTPVETGIRPTDSFKSTKQINIALESMPICTAKKVIFRTQLIGIDDLITL